MKLNEIAEQQMNVEQFISHVKESYMRTFPRGWIYVRNGAMGKDSLYFTIGIQPRDKISNGIEHNDPARQIISMYKCYNIDTKIMNDRIVAEGGGSLSIKPGKDSFNAYDSVKFGYRKKTGTPEAILAHLDRYFAKMLTVVQANMNNLADDIS